MATKITNADIGKIMNGDVRLLVKESKRFGEELAADRVSKAQIRGAFGTVREINATWKDEPNEQEAQTQLRNLLMLKPRLAYQGKRKSEVQPLADVLTLAIDAVSDASTQQEQSRRFHNFVDLFEAILAYHTAAGGK
jgi:CRISPR-associated protein Csm2